MKYAILFIMFTVWWRTTTWSDLVQFRRVVKLREVFHVLLYAVSRFDEGCKKELAASCAGENGANDEQDVKEASQVSQVGQ